MPLIANFYFFFKTSGNENSWEIKETTHTHTHTQNTKCNRDLPPHRHFLVCLGMAIIFMVTSLMVIILLLLFGRIRLYNACSPLVIWFASKSVLGKRGHIQRFTSSLFLSIQKSDLDYHCWKLSISMFPKYLLSITNNLLSF